MTNPNYTMDQASYRAELEAKIREHYKLADMQPPEDFLWFDSPLATTIAGTLISAMQEIVKNYPVIDEEADFEELVNDLRCIARNTWHKNMLGGYQVDPNSMSPWWWYPSYTFVAITDRPEDVVVTKTSSVTKFRDGWHCTVDVGEEETSAA